MIPVLSSAACIGRHDLFEPMHWLTEWSIYLFRNERARDDYDRRTAWYPAKPWNERTLMGLYQSAFRSVRGASISPANAGKLRATTKRSSEPRPGRSGTELLTPSERG